MRLILAIFCLLASQGLALADEPVFTYLKTVSVAELNRMLDAERANFIANEKAGEGYQLPPVGTAANDIELFTVRYPSHVPEQGNRPIMATGLIALPVLADRSHLPVIVYEHGTVYGKYEVPSYAFQDSNPSDYPHYDGSYETRYMAGLFAGNGYVLIAADYFGMGGSAAEPEAYLVKGSTQAASEDLYRAAAAFLATKGIAQQQLFIGGWSQGGLNATGLQERFETDGIPLTATFTASAPADPYATLNGLIFYPRPGVDAPWVNTIMALSVFALQNYFGPPDLARQTLDPAVYDDMKAIYERSYKGQQGLLAIMKRHASRQLVEYLKPDLRDPVHFGVSPYARLLANNETYRQTFGAPIRMYFGSVDEAVKPMIGVLVAAYQAVLIGNLSDQSGNHVSPIDVKGGTHRLTFISAAPAAKAWMDELRK